MARAEHDLLQGTYGAHVSAESARQRLVAGLGAPMHAFARSLGGACQRRSQHHRIGAQRECLDEAAGITHTAVGNHLHIASARFVHVIAAGLGDIGDGCGHRRVHSNRVAVGGYRTATEADKHASGSVRIKCNAAV